MIEELPYIIIKGASEHNLKNIDVAIPKKKLVVITGVSGSGKSSLAFDTLFAEGQRRYVESLSSYARQFLGQMEKPKYESIKGLAPAISIEQKSASKNPRSTVGTITEIYDYLRVLFAKIGKQHCYQCGRAVSRQEPQQIVAEILKLPERTRFLILAPVIVSRKGEHRDVLSAIQKEGFSRVRIDGQIKELTEVAALDKNKKHDIDIVVDRLIQKADIQSRVTDSIETALKAGKGRLMVHDLSTRQDIIFSEDLSCEYCGLSFPELSPQLFSFNNPQGMCSTCNGLGFKPEMDADLVIPDPRKSIADGAIEPFAKSLQNSLSWTYDYFSGVCKSLKIDIYKPFKDLTQQQRHLILYGSDQLVDINLNRQRLEGVMRLQFEGVLNILYRRYQETQSEMMKGFYQKYFSTKRCGVCQGTRLRKEVSAIYVAGQSIIDLNQMTIAHLYQFFDGLKLIGNAEIIGRELIKEIQSRLFFLVSVGLDYLALDRQGPSLSGGESQRIRLASQIGSELTGVMYVLDEPSIGLHQKDNKRLIQTLKHLRDIGNTVIVVEHDAETMMSADHIIDIGPGAGAHGGEVVYAGDLAGIKLQENSLTGLYLSGKKQIEVPPKRRPHIALMNGTLHRGVTRHSHLIRIAGAKANNLKAVSVDLPLGLFICITGVSGAGKSTLVNHILLPYLLNHLYQSNQEVGQFDEISGIEQIDKVVNIDQSPIGRTPRSNPATYTKAFDFIREIFANTEQAKMYGYNPGRFSFNVKGGRCEACAGDGLIKVEMHFLPDVYVPCEICRGKRFNEATLKVKYKGLNIAQVLELTVDEAYEFFLNFPRLKRILQTLRDVGLSYVKLGQSSPTLSGGEAQRIKLSRELAKKDTGKTLYVLDEPTTGLHFDDIKKLLAVLNRLVDLGNTVVVIEHNLDVIKCADYIVDLGPDGGDRGGEVIVSGTPEYVAHCQRSYTGEFLKKVLPPG